MEVHAAREIHVSRALWHPTKNIPTHTPPSALAQAPPPAPYEFQPRSARICRSASNQIPSSVTSRPSERHCSAI